MGKKEGLVSGAEQACKIGMVVTVDIENGATTGVRGGMLKTVSGRVMVTGVLTCAEDRFRGDELASTLLTVGGTFVSIDWDEGNGPAAIETA